MAGLLTKESFLIHVVIMAFYLAVFHRERVRAKAPYYLVLVAVLLGLYYFNYVYLFGLHKKYIVPPIAITPGDILFHSVPVSDFIRYFSFRRGSLAHAVANLLLAFGATNVVVLWLWNQEKARLRMLFYAAVLFAAYLFVTFNIATEQRYALLCFAPSYLVLIGKRVEKIDGNRRAPLMLVAIYLVNAAAIVAYSMIQHRIT